MNTAEVQARMQSLGAYPGIQGCALVDADTGMVWYHAGELQELEGTAEVAIEVWRVQQRNAGRFASFGPLQSAATSFAEKVVALFPCTASGLVLVCVAAKGAIDWSGWGAQVQQLKLLLAPPAR